ncbi:heparan-alpha-glucosaminide N-acetyltransferase domain-containing protein [Nesterenkonia ebinurensis]|uniref:heparan-alpha-glucosaminide N-acetyltransferase domain-containing protein n=1 Tax=Nesterenkonia ebinurensis TaxID=2608252 RepID=UPI00123DDFDF|nr:heparan-alpha-glucosaminide N-acetyltransferase domain-containing protein [Nesterenkonia ebinurensis]
MSRLWGVDAARGIALLGMMTVHVLPTSDPVTGEATWAGLLFSGRSAALFAVLAGVGLALLTSSAHTSEAGAARRADFGREGRGNTAEEDPRPQGPVPTSDVAAGHVGDQAGHVPAAGPSTAWFRRVVALRALLIILIGLACAILGSGVAIILVHYGLMFFLALPFLRLGARGLALLAAAWVALAPPAYWWLQNQLRASPLDQPERLWHSPGFPDLAEPGLLGLDLAVTGYYPLLLWPAYLFAGMAVGRLNLRRAGVQLQLLLFGTAGAAFTYGAGGVVLQHSGLSQRMLPFAANSPTALQGSLETGDHFLPLVTDPLWFLIPMPHQGSTMDLLHTISCAVAVLGLCLVLSRWLSWPLAPLAGAGAMPLSLYVGHLLILGPFWRMEGAVFPQIQDHMMILLLVVGALALGALKVRLRRRGPLEAFTHYYSTGLAGEPR